MKVGVVIRDLCSTLSRTLLQSRRNGIWALRGTVRAFCFYVDLWLF